MNKSKFFDIIDTLTALLIGGYLIKIGLTGKSKQLLAFFIDNGLSFVKWLAAILTLYGIGYLIGNKLKDVYWTFLTLTLLLSKMGDNLIKLTK